MADTRINALSTATSSVSDDFVPIDGTTNGTRKLNAFSPTFGGNATVTGNLTVNTALSVTNGVSANELTCTGGYAVLRGFGGSVDTGALYLGQSANNNFISSNLTTMASYIANTAITSTVAAGFRVLTTTASTSTTTGALVVGNGTSGGLGVGGAVNIGGTLTANGTTFNLSTASANGSFINMDGLAGNFKIITTRTGGVDRWYFGQDTAAESGSNAGSPFFIRALTDAGAVIDTPLTITRAAGGRLTTPRPVTISDSTASTSTSSGALVVSGGVGVAKEMYLGGGLLNVAKGGAGATIEINADSGFASKLAMQRAATNRWTLEVDSSDVLTLKSLGTTAALTMTGTTSAEFVGSIKTAAPSGGTAANWKLGTVASVSPTSPNRTIEVDIGGTIYYIHAKTTNN